MEAIIKSCAGLDIHQKTIVASVIYGRTDKCPKITTRSFQSTTSGLFALSDWLQQFQCSHIAMESTGVYWKPVWNILEGQFDVILANAKQIKNVPGRKTDVNDSVWIAKLLRAGLIERSFIPPTEIRDLRDLTRYREKLVGNTTQEKNRIHKVLEDANIKLSSYMTDIFSVSGRALLSSIIAGETLNYHQVHKLVKTSLKKKIPALLEAMNGQIRYQHRRMIMYHFKNLVHTEQLIREVENDINDMLYPYKELEELLVTIPGIGHDAAAVIIAELGSDMSFFPSDKHLASWAGLSPSNNESAGIRKSSRITSGNRNLKAALYRAAWSASMTKGTRLSAFHKRIRIQRGNNKASVATAHLILRIIYHVIKDSKPYKELGVNYCNHTPQSVENIIEHISAIGYTVSLN